MSSTRPGLLARQKLEELIKYQKDALTLPWLGMTAGIGMYAVVLSLVTDGLYDQEVPKAAVIVVGVVAAALAGLSLWLPRKLASDAHIATYLRSEPDAHAIASSMHGDDHQHEVRSLPKRVQLLLGLVTLYRRPYLIGLGLSGAVAFVGFLLGFSIKSLGTALPFFLLSLLLNAVHYPRPMRLIERGRKLEPPDEDLQEVERQIRQVRTTLRRK